MQLNSNTLEQRWAMLTNSFALLVPLICKVTELEIIEHLILVDTLSGRPLNHSQMKQCRKRFRQFCETQWLWRNRNKN